MIVTIRDAYQRFVEGCGAEAPIRDERDLQELIMDCDLRYEEIGDSFWEAVGETGWAWDRAVSSGTVLDTYERLVPTPEQCEWDGCDAVGDRDVRWPWPAGDLVGVFCADHAKAATEMARAGGAS